MMQSNSEAQERLLGLGEFLGTDKYEEDRLETHKYLLSNSRDVGISLFRYLSLEASFCCVRSNQ